MTDDQMFQMDAALAAAVGASVKSGGDAKQASQQLLSFKQRVLGLVEIYVKKVHAVSDLVVFRLLHICCLRGADPNSCHQLCTRATDRQKCAAGLNCTCLAACTSRGH